MCMTYIRHNILFPSTKILLFSVEFNYINSLNYIFFKSLPANIFPTNNSNPYMYTSDILKGDILKGDILKGDILKGDILKGNISQSIRL